MSEMEQDIDSLFSELIECQIEEIRIERDGGL